MESRLPKPSGIRRPTPVLKGILPMDRIKQSSFSAFNKFGPAGGGGSTIPTNFAPLSRDLTNLPTNTRGM